MKCLHKSMQTQNTEDRSKKLLLKDMKGHDLVDIGAGPAGYVADKKYGEILGAHMIGPEVTELLPELTLAQANELPTTNN